MPIDNFLCIFVSDIYLFHLLLSALLGVTILSYMLSFTAVVLFFVFYTKPDGCFINKFFISFNMLFCIVASVVSVLPKVQVRDREQCFSAEHSVKDKQSFDAAMQKHEI